MNRKMKFVGVTAFALTAILPSFAPREYALREYSARAEVKNEMPQPEAAKIDAKAKVALDAMRNAYSAAKTFRGDVSLRTSGFADRPRFDANVKFRRDAQIALKNVSESGEENVVSDGATLLDTNSLHEGSYLRIAAPKPAALLQAAFGQIGAQNTVLFRLLGKNDVLKVFGSALKTVRLGSEDDARRAQEIATKTGVAVDAKEADVVVAEYSRSKKSGTVFYFIGKTDHLLRAAVTEQKDAAKTMTVVETHSGATLNSEFSDADFSTEPPGGWQKVNGFPTPSYDPRLKIGGEPFALNANDIDGKPVSLDDYKGKVLLLDFWASWCPPCREEAPEVARLYGNFKDSGFEVLGVSLDDSVSKARGFMQSSGMTWRQLCDGGAWDSEYSRLYGVGSIPFTVLIGQDGKIAAIGARGQLLTHRVQQALNGARAERPDIR